MLRQIVLFAVIASVANANPIQNRTDSNNTQTADGCEECGNFNLTQFEQDQFTPEIKGIANELFFTKWRIFGLLRAFYAKENEEFRKGVYKMYNAVSEKFFSKSAIYEALQLTNLNLKELEKQKVGIDLTIEETEKLNGMMNQIYDQLFPQKKVFTLVRAIFDKNETDTLRDTIGQGFHGIVFSEGPIQALYQTATSVYEQLQNMTVNETGKQKYDLFAADIEQNWTLNRVFQTVIALTTDEKVLNEAIKILKNIADAEKVEISYIKIEVKKFTAKHAKRFSKMIGY